MIGRAGRPGLDTTGVAVVMTDTDSKKRFEHLASSGLSPAMSQCSGDKFVETINTEVSQRVITSTESAINWIKGTLYYVQTVQNPSARGIRMVSAHSIDTHLLPLCMSALQQLQAIGAIVVTDEQEILPLPASHIMSQHLVHYQTMKQQIVQLPFDATQYQVLKALASIEGLQRPVRRNEKKALNAAHKILKLHKLEGPPSKVRVKEPWEKAFVLLQVYIEGLELEGNDYAMRQEMNSMVEYASRMLAAIEEYSAKGSKHGNVAVQSLKIRRALAVHLWNGNDGLLRQIKGISKSLSYSLHLAGISTFDNVMQSSEEKIEKAASRSPPFGADLRKACSKLLRSRLKISASIETAAGAVTPSSLICSLERVADTEEAVSSFAEASGKNSDVTYTLVAYTDRPGGGVLFKENIAGPETFKALIPSRFGKISVRLIAGIVGLDDSFDLEGNDEIAPSSMFGSQAAKGASAKRIRNGNQKKREAIKNQVTQPGSSVVPADPRIRPKNSTAGAHRSVSQKLRQSRLQLTPDQASVTPSPKPPPNTTCEATRIQNPPARRSANAGVRSQAARPSQSIATRPVISQEKITEGPQRSAQEATFAHPDLSRRIRARSPVAWEPATGSRATRNNANKPVRQGSDYPSVQQAAAAAAARSSRPSVGWESKRAAEPAQNDSDSRFMTGVASWKRTKRQHQKLQERAFEHKKLNPFSNYKHHDPNDGESYLDALSSQSSIIPPSALAFNSQYASQQRAVYQPSHSFGRQQRSRRDFPGARMTTQEILAEKAAEQNMQASMCQSPPWGSQSWCSQPEESHQSSWNDADPTRRTLPNHHMGFQSEPRYLGEPEVWSGNVPGYEPSVQDDSRSFGFQRDEYGPSSIPPPEDYTYCDYSQQTHHGPPPFGSQYGAQPQSFGGGGVPNRYQHEPSFF